MILNSNAIVDPRAMMIISFNTFVANTAML
jgi:hypothetical protein